jgi:hypothetical protein
VITVLTVNGQPVNCVALPTSPGLRTVEFSFADSVALTVNDFTGITQAQQWLGADQLSGTMTLPPLTQCQADEWIAALMELRGMANAMLLGDPLKTSPRGNPLGAPAFPATITDIAGNQTVETTGWTPGKFGLLLPGDYIQIGYRLHRVVGAPVNSDSSGNATIAIWPSLREPPIASQALITSNCVGLFRRASNKAGWSADYTRLSRASFQVQEYR